MTTFTLISEYILDLATPLGDLARAEEDTLGSLMFAPGDGLRLRQEDYDAARRSGPPAATVPPATIELIDQLPPSGTPYGTGRILWDDIADDARCRCGHPYSAHGEDGELPCTEIE